MVRIANNSIVIVIDRPSIYLGDVREKLRLAFDMYDMNKNGKVKHRFISFSFTTYRYYLNSRECSFRDAHKRIYATISLSVFHFCFACQSESLDRLNKTDEQRSVVLYSKNNY
jgi:hypothetical protein